MALTFPRDMTTAHRWDVADLQLRRRQEHSRTAGGGQISADLGPALWSGQFRSHPLRRNAADALHADFLTLRGGLRTFLAHPAERPRPASAVPGQTGLASAVVHAVAADRSRLRLAGLPADLALVAGDWLSISTAAGGREAVRLARDALAGAGGVTDWVEVEPALRPAVAVADAVALAPALLEVRLLPETLLRERVGGAWYAVTFDCLQVIR